LHLTAFQILRCAAIENGVIFRLPRRASNSIFSILLEHCVKFTYFETSQCTCDLLTSLATKTKIDLVLYFSAIA